MAASSTAAKVLLIEPFCGGSHKQLMTLLQKHIPFTELVSLPAKKWHWRARTSALYLSQVIPRSDSYRTLFASSVLNLAELVALRPDLAKLRKILYFHENQMVYPVRKQQERDFQFGYNQILSSLVADEIMFNSRYNMESFLSGINSHLKLIPDFRTKGIADLLRPKCQVLYFPLHLPGKTDIDDNTPVGEHQRHFKMDSGVNESVDVSGTISMKHVNARSFKSQLNSSDEHTENSIDTNVLSSNVKNVGCPKSSENASQEMDSCANSVTEGICDRTMSTISYTEKTVKKLKTSDSDVKDDKAEDLSSIQHTATSDCGQENTDLDRSSRPLHIIWPHRWEHDKNPEMFFRVLYQLKDTGLTFRVSVLGETYTKVPDIFEEARHHLGDYVCHWGFQESKSVYYRILQEADCVISTANHEFFGVAMLEAVHLGCYPLCPSRLVYPEIFPKEYLYNTENQLFKRLKQFCTRPAVVRNHHIQVNVEQYAWPSLEQEYKQILLKDFD